MIYYVYKCPYCGERYTVLAGQVHDAYDHETCEREQFVYCPKCLSASNIDEFIDMTVTGRNNGVNQEQIFAGALRYRYRKRVRELTSDFIKKKWPTTDLTVFDDSLTCSTRYLTCGIYRDGREVGVVWADDKACEILNNKGDNNMKTNKTEEKTNKVEIVRKDRWDRRPYYISSSEPGDYIRIMDDPEANIYRVVDEGDLGTKMQAKAKANLDDYVLCINVETAELKYIKYDTLVWWYAPKEISIRFGGFIEEENRTTQVL